jgi:hypothetical protein
VVVREAPDDHHVDLVGRSGGATDEDGRPASSARGAMTRSVPPWPRTP